VQIIRDVIRDNQSFTIAGHEKPDGDAIGACYGLAMALAVMGKEAHVLIEPYGDKFNIIPGRHLQHKRPYSGIKPQVFIALDCGDADRLSNEIHQVYTKASVTVCIDHHETNTGFARYNWIDAEASSTCEMIYKLLEPMMGADMNVEIASALYAGMIYDTGGFRHSSVAPETLSIAGRLISKSIPFSEIFNEVLYSHRFNAAKIMGKALDEAKLSMNGLIVYSCITYAMFKEAKADFNDLDGIVEYLINVKGTKAAVLLYERQGPSGELTEVKVSFRSRGIRIDHIALKLGGGGHAYAAGCTIYGDIHKVAKQVLDLLENELAPYA
jgi:phosphoesterase RecJ-like protein